MFTKVRDFKFSSIKVYIILAVPILLFGSEIFTPRKRIKLIVISRNGTVQENRIEGCTRFDHKKEENILEDLKLEPVDEKLRRHK
jgi:hypothetical protein